MTDDGTGPANRSACARVGVEIAAMQPPVSAALMREREPVSAFHRRVFLGIKAFVDHDALLVEEHRPKDVWGAARARNAKKTVRVVELDPEFQVLLKDVLDGNGWNNDDAPGPGIFGQQRGRILLDGLGSQIGHFYRHWSAILICIAASA